MESLMLLFGMLAVSALIGLAGVRMAKRKPWAGLAAVTGSAMLVGGIAIGMLPLMTQPKAVESAYERAKAQHGETQLKLVRCEADLAAGADVLARLWPAHRHLSQRSLGLNLPTVREVGGEPYQRAAAVLASIEAAIAADDLGDILEAFRRVSPELRQLGLTLDEAMFLSADRSRRIAMIAEAVRSVRTPPACVPRGSIRDKLSRPVETPHYRIERISVKGGTERLSGEWFLVTLRSARSGNLLSFSPENLRPLGVQSLQYMLSEEVEEEIQRSIAALWSDVIAELPASRRLFVRGRSNPLSWSGPILPGDEKATVIVHAGSEQTGYTSAPTRRSLVVNNTELPNWRGRYLTRIIPGVSALAGEPNTTVLGELLLQINW